VRDSCCDVGFTSLTCPRAYPATVRLLKLVSAGCSLDLNHPIVDGLAPRGDTPHLYGWSCESPPLPGTTRCHPPPTCHAAVRWRYSIQGWTEVRQISAWGWHSWVQRIWEGERIETRDCYHLHIRSHDDITGSDLRRESPLLDLGGRPHQNDYAAAVPKVGSLGQLDSSSVY
jgi:hypothetical protein